MTTKAFRRLVGEGVGLREQRVLVAGVEVRGVAEQVVGVEDAGLRVPVVEVTAEEMVLAAEVVIDACGVLVEGLEHGLLIVDGVADEAGAGVRGRGGEVRLIVDGRGIEGGRRNAVEGIENVGEGIANLLAGRGAVSACVKAGFAEIAEIGVSGEARCGAAFFRERGNGAAGGGDLVGDGVLIAEEELRGLAVIQAGDDHRAADGAAELIDDAGCPLWSRSRGVR